MSATQRSGDAPDPITVLAELVAELLDEVREMRREPPTSLQDDNGNTIWLAGSGWLR